MREPLTDWNKENVACAKEAAQDDERAAFEAHWCRDVPSMFRNAALAELKANRDGERYKRDEVQWAWEAWQARAASPQRGERNDQ